MHDLWRQRVVLLQRQVRLGLVSLAEAVVERHIQMLDVGVVLSKDLRRVYFVGLQRAQPFVRTPQSRVQLQGLSVILHSLLLLRLQLSYVAQ